MYIQRVLARVDKGISAFFGLQEWAHCNTNGDHRWTYFVDIGKAIGIVGADGNVHTVASYWSVRHYNEDGKLVRRIPVRKDLKEGERLATGKEIAQHRAERQALCDSAHIGARV